MRPISDDRLQEFVEASERTLATLDREVKARTVGRWAATAITILELAIVLSFLYGLVTISEKQDHIMKQNRELMDSLNPERK